MFSDSRREYRGAEIVCQQKGTVYIFEYIDICNCMGCLASFNLSVAVSMAGGLGVVNGERAYSRAMRCAKGEYCWGRGNMVYKN